MIFTSILIGFYFSGMAYGQSDKAAYKALKNLEARITAGINYQEYNTALADAKVEVDSFIENKKEVKIARLVDALNKALVYYQKANEIWKIQIDTNNKYFAKNNEKGKEIERIYPRAEKSYEKDGEYYFVPMIRRQLWSEASKELKKASH